MYLCLRRTRYKGETREYPSYRCNRKGCQTFRSIRKVFSRQFILSNSEDIPVENLDIETDRKVKKSTVGQDLSAHRLCIPKLLTPSLTTPATLIGEKLKGAQLKRCISFTEFTNQLRRDIAANKQVLRRKARGNNDIEEGTLIYVTKELSPQEIVQLQDAIIKVLMHLRKIPVQLTSNDLPLFAHCPYSKDEVEIGLKSESTRQTFCEAFSKAPQPPIPAGFTQREDNVLVYKNPAPYHVPPILQANSPRKTAEDIADYHRRQEEIETRKMEKRLKNSIKNKASGCMKRVFSDEIDMDRELVERHEFKRPKMDGLSQISHIQLLDAHNSYDTAKWKELEKEDAACPKKACALAAEYAHRRKESSQSSDVSSGSSDYATSPDALQKSGTLSSITLHEMMMRSLNPTTSASQKAYGNDQKVSSSQPLLFNDYPAAQPQSAYFVNAPLLSESATLLNMNLYSQSNVSDNVQCMSANSHMNEKHYIDSPNSHNQFTYINPESGATLTDPSAFLTTFVPSPVVKNAPVDFGQEGSKHFTKGTLKQENTSLSSVDMESPKSSSKLLAIDNSLKFDPPNI
ncbi:unnamed protein product [Caenorhabditis bovis]|uniref:Uncharacterized protein n=1 Tax=Caenorhabditis bovis TaxID=2654633 RepID=A0A8S1F0Y0_9PELO|nr:unnamed protein product [Caenorhabditis bovis]